MKRKPAKTLKDVSPPEKSMSSKSSSILMSDWPTLAPR